MKGVKKLYRLFSLFLKINWIKTIFLNLKTQNISDAFKFPILVFGKLKIYDLSGRIEIRSQIKFGIVQLGRDWDHFPASSLPVKLQVRNKIIIEGPFLLSGGCTITSWGGDIVFGKYVRIGSGTVIKSSSHIKIGDYTGITAECVIMDTNVHYVINNNSGTVKNAVGDIVIGKYCWINPRTVISKGTIVPDYSISARSSYLNGDYTRGGKNGLLLVGSPAKVIDANHQRIFSIYWEKKLSKFFKDNSSLNKVSLFQIIGETSYKEVDSDFDAFFLLY